MISEEERTLIFAKHYIKDDEGVFKFSKKDLQVLLNLIETQNKMIELMAELIFNHANSFEWWENGLDIDNLEQQIEYFRNKAKESE